MPSGISFSFVHREYYYSSQQTAMRGNIYARETNKKNIEEKLEFPLTFLVSLQSDNIIRCSCVCVRCEKKRFCLFVCSRCCFTSKLCATDQVEIKRSNQPIQSKESKEKENEEIKSMANRQDRYRSQPQIQYTSLMSLTNGKGSTGQNSPIPSKLTALERAKAVGNVR